MTSSRLTPMNMLASAALFVLCLAQSSCDSEPARETYVSPPRVRAPAPRVVAAAPSRPDHDGMPAEIDIPRDIMNLPDAVPRFEPRSALGNPDSYEVYGERYSVLTDFTGFKERGIASWYGTKFHGKSTSSGEPYDMFQMTAAHKTLPIPCYVRVSNLNNGRTAIVRVNDRGPFHDERIIDLSYVAALKLGIIGEGSAPVEIEALTPETPTLTARTAMPAPAINPPPVSAPPPLATAPNPALATVAAPAAARPIALNAGPATLTNTATAGGLFDNAGYYWLQAGSFVDPQNAAALRDQLASLGIANVQLKERQRGAASLHRVLIGPFADVRSRDAMRSRLASAQMPSMPVTD